MERVYTCKKSTNKNRRSLATKVTGADRSLLEPVGASKSGSNNQSFSSGGGRPSGLFTIMNRKAQYNSRFVDYYEQKGGGQSSGLRTITDKKGRNRQVCKPL